MRVLSVTESRPLGTPCSRTTSSRCRRAIHKPVVFLEFGYTDDLASPALPHANEGLRLFPKTSMETASMTEGTNRTPLPAFFNVDARHDNRVRGAFLRETACPTLTSTSPTAA